MHDQFIEVLVSHHAALHAAVVSAQTFAARRRGAEVARALNASYGRWENFWATEQPSNVRLVGTDDVLAKMIYTVSNPVAVGLVSHGEKWPGLRLFTPGVRKGAAT